VLKLTEDEVVQVAIILNETEDREIGWASTMP
jgi:hypothetical protein